MRKYFLIASVLTLAACNPKDDTATPDDSKLEKWEVERSHAEAMIENADKCSLTDTTLCKNINAEDVLNAGEALSQKYADSGYAFEFIRARYIDDADEKRYRETHSLKDDDKAGMVKGYATLLLKISDSTKNFAKYFDFVKVCPPADSGTCSAAALKMMADAPDPEEWKLPKEDAWRMMKYFDDFPKRPKAWPRDPDMIAAIISAYPLADHDTVSVPARYQTWGDYQRYRRLRGYGLSEERGWVRHQGTFLFAVISKTKTKMVGDTTFFDIAYACPPPFPPECDLIYVGGKD
jgi:hypothetical protein